MERTEEQTPGTPKLALFNQPIEKKDFFNNPLITLSPDCTFGAYRNQKGDIDVANLLTKQTFSNWPTSAWPGHLEFINDQQLAYIDKQDNSVWIQDLFGIKIKCPLDEQLRPIKLVSTGSDVLLILSLHIGKKTGTLHCWNTNLAKGLSLSEITTTVADQIPVFFNDNKLISYANIPATKPTINIFSFAKIATALQTETSLCQMKKLEGHSAAINDLALFRTKQLLASASDDMMVLIWDLATNNTHSFYTQLPHQNKVVSVVFHPSEFKFLLCTTAPEKSTQFGAVHLWNHLAEEKLIQFEPTEYSSIGRRSLRWPMQEEIFIGSQQHIWHKFKINFNKILEKWREEKNRN